jgi:hypothetical protein
VYDCLLQGSGKFWSEKVSTPNILGWKASHSKKIGVQTFPLQIGVHEGKIGSAFSLTQQKSQCQFPKKKRKVKIVSSALFSAT